MSFAKGYALLKLLEGNESTVDPVPTWGGITQVRWNLYADAHGIKRCWPPAGDVEITDLWRSGYWTPAHCDEFPEPADSVIFQLAANVGPGMAITIVQVAFGAWPDGMWGAESQSALRTAKNPNSGSASDALILATQRAYYWGLRNAYRKEHGTEHPSFHGWWNRTLRVADAIRAGTI